jgi:hypothetical protein
MNPSGHFQLRQVQGRLSLDDVQYILEYGTVCYRAGVKMVFLGKRNVPQSHSRNPNIERLINVAVLLSPTGDVLITTYKNPSAFRDHKKKSKLNHHD